MPISPPPPFEEGDLYADRAFEDLSLDSADLAGKEFQRCVFRRCKLPASRWTEARLEDCTFEQCDLARIVPTKILLRGVTFNDSRLMGVDWSGIGTLPSVQFEKCDLRYSSFVKLKLRKTRFVGCIARETNFIDVDLTEADFTGTDATGSTVQGCVLVKANFTTTTGLFFDPRANQVKGVRISVETAVSFAQSLGMAVDGY